VPEPERVVDKPFLMRVEDVFTITGRGRTVAIVATCRLSAPEPGRITTTICLHSRGGDVHVSRGGDAGSARAIERFLADVSRRGGVVLGRGGAVVLAYVPGTLHVYLGRSRGTGASSTWSTSTGSTGQWQLSGERVPDPGLHPGGPGVRR
jgi:hypothetical protein